MTVTRASWIGGWHATTDFFASGNLYIGLGQTVRGGNLTVEANVQRKAILAYTISSLSCQVTSSTTGANTTSLNVRKNGANGSGSVVLTSSVTGFLKDGTHTDSIATADLINEAFVGTSSSPDCFIITTAIAIVGATTPISEFTWSALGPTDTNSYSLSGSTDTFTQLSGGTAAAGAGETTETDTSKMLVRASGTYQGLQAALTTNTSGSTIKFRKNGVTGSQTISPATASGTVVLTQDATHTDSVVSGDKADYVFNAAGHTMNTLWVGSTCNGAASRHDIYLSEQSATTSIGTTDVFMSTGGSWGTNSSQTQARTPTLYAVTFSRLRIHIKTNSQSNATSFLGNTGGVDMTETIAIGAGVTGLLEDTTHTDAIVSGHNVNYQFRANAGSGTMIYDWAGALMDDGSVPSGSTETGTITTTFSGISQTITANDHTSQITSTFSGISQSLAANDHHATITTTFSGISQTATGGREEPGIITTNFSGISQSLTGNDHTAHITSTFSGISQSLSGTDGKAGVITTTLSGLGQSGSLLVVKVHGTITTGFTGISQSLAGADLTELPALRQFWTFGNT